MKIDDPFDKNSPKSFRICAAASESDISVVEIGYNRVPRGIKQIMKRNIFIIHYIINGKGSFLGEKFGKNNGYIVYPDELEIVEADKHYPYEAYWIMFQGASSRDILKKCGFPNHNGVFGFDKNEQCAEILKNALFEINPNNEFEEHCLMKAAFYRIIALHMQDKNNTASALTVAQRTKEFIDNNYYNKIKITDIAKKNNYTRNYLCTLFKREYNSSPQEYLLSLRIEKAKMLLRDRTENLSISEISSAVGFNDSLYFSRLFHKKTGMSPTEFRHT